MKILFFHACAFNKAPLCELIDEAEKFAREGNEVFFAYCGGTMEGCFSNPVMNRLDCKVCSHSMRKSLKMLDPSVKLMDLSKLAVNKLFDWQYDTAAEIKQIKYKEVEIGYAVMSLYISTTRNLSPKIDAQTKPYFDALLTSCATLVDAFASAIDTVLPDKVCLFNGRYFESRPALAVPRLRNIPTDVYELIDGPDGKYRKVIFRNALPHNINALQSLMEDGWNKSKKSLEEKIAIGKSFFEKRRNGIAAGDKVYVAGQTAGLLPEGWDETKCNIAIFNSSEDEFASIGTEFEKYSVYPSQIEGIRSLLKRFAGDDKYHFYLRVHPNLGKIKYKYHLDLYKLDKEYDNITVIPAMDPISSYSLMDAAEKVVVFGSSMGVEASYWKKPVILLSGSMYYNYDICYKPKDEAQLVSLLRTENLPSKFDELSCCKYGFYILDKDRGEYKESYHYFNYNPFDVKIGGKVFHGTYCQKMLGSRKLYAGYVAALREVAKLMSRPAHKIPKEEE